jgi:hypothetical protein
LPRRGSARPVRVRLRAPRRHRSDRRARREGLLAAALGEADVLEVAKPSGTRVQRAPRRVFAFPLESALVIHSRGIARVGIIGSIGVFTKGGGRRFDPMTAPCSPGCGQRRDRCPPPSRE